MESTQDACQQAADLRQAPPVFPATPRTDVPQAAIELPDLTGWVIVRPNDVPVEGLCRGRRVPNLNRLAERSMFHNGDEQTEQRARVKWNSPVA
jgi:hypothetical protein